MDSDTRQNWHEYEIDWKPDQTKWLIDGKVVRTLKRDDTYNETTKQHNYPQTPSRVQLSLWPGGLESNGKGTIEWAGGLVDWDNKDLMPNGYYYAEVKDISVECYDPPNNQNADGNSYYYSSTSGTEDTVVIGKNSTVIGSMSATGNDPDEGKPSPSSDSKSSSTSSSKSSSTATRAPESVPGMSGGGNAGNSGGSSSGSSNSDSSDSGNSQDTSGSAFDTPGSDEGPTSFQQNGNEGDSGSASSNTSQANHVVAGSAVALLGFFIAALML